MRLIDADALKKAFDDYIKANPNISGIFEVGKYIIDNAPTVFSCNACKNMGNERECVDCHDYSNYVHYEERPQGEWIDYNNTFYKCPDCGYLLEKCCPQCQNKVILPKGGAE